MLDIEVISHVPAPVDTRWVTQAIHDLLRHQNVLRAAISVAVVDDPTIHQINRDHLGHDYPTDVITFPGEPLASTGILAGELLISWDTAVEQAAERGLTPTGELLLYALHGTLHLLGWDDRDPQSAARMREAEREALERMGFPYHYPDDQDWDA